MAEKSTTDSQVLPDIECACASVRRAARLVTQLYSLEMGGNVEPAQFSLLSALSGHPGASQAKLGRALGLDKTTLSRNLRLLERNGWIELRLTDDDHRERGYRLTTAGKKVFAATRAGWARAQAKLRGALHEGEWEAMMQVFGRVAGAAIVAKKRGKTA
jgi:DNA-binding MarR family transcriptional regulator